MIDKKILLAAALGLAAASTPLVSAAAGLYKWVDEQGVTHYTQHPPATGDAREITPPPPAPADPENAAERLEAQRQELDRRREARQQQARERGEEAKSWELREEACRMARKNLATLEAHNRIALKDGEGNYTYLNEEQRQERLAEARRQVEEYCVR